MDGVCGLCGGILVAGHCVDCGDRHNFTVPEDKLVPYKLEVANNVTTKKGDLIQLIGFNDQDVIVRITDIKPTDRGQELSLEVVNV